MKAFYDERNKNLGDNTFLAREMFSSGCRLRLKNARKLPIVEDASIVGCMKLRKC